MNTIKDLVKKPPVFTGEFTCDTDVFDEFELNHGYRENTHILFAYYISEDYAGEAFVLFERNSKLYEVNGGHCSCHGLAHRSYDNEDSQWDEEETSIEEIIYRKKNKEELEEWEIELLKFLEE